MELGKANLRRNGINTLVNALHSKHGLVWTDGRGVYLTNVRLLDNQVANNDSIKLGEFEYVQSLHWSAEYAGAVCYLCVVHQNTVTLWKVTGHSPDLHLKQVRKINATPIPQGVLWNPTKDTVCILNRDHASFYFRHGQNKGSYALPSIESGKITSGCWSLDGKKLLIGIGSIILVYQWEDVAKNISDYSLIAWKIPNVEGRISALTALSNTWMVCSAELPIESLCQSSNSDMFTIPEFRPEKNGVQNGSSSSSMKDQPPSMKEETNNLRSLLSLQRNTPSQRSSHLVMFEVPYSQREPKKITGVPLRGLLAPDLIHYDANLRRVTVGSNTQPCLQVFQATDTQLWKLQDIRLDVDERPKGICGMVMRGSQSPPEGVLVMVGCAENTDTAFLPSSTRAAYKTTLTFQPFHTPALACLEQLLTSGQGSSQGVSAVPLDPYSTESIFKELQLPSSNTKVHLLRINPLKQDQPKPEASLPKPESSFSKPEASFYKPEASSYKPEASFYKPEASCYKPEAVPPEPSSNQSSPASLSKNQSTEDEASSSNGDRGPGFLRLPPSVQVAARRGKILLLQGEDRDDTESELDIEHASFEDQPANFVNNLERLMHNLPHDPCLTNCSPVKDNSEGEAEGQFHHSGFNTHLPHPHRQLQHKDKTLSSSNGSTASSDNVSGVGMEPKMQRRVSLESDPLSARDRVVSSELPQQVSALETQISAQGSQINKLQERIDYISRLLEETSMVSASQYQSLASPELIHVNLEPLPHEDGAALKKTFVLDNNRLQLDPIKQTFGLLTVELLFDGIPCVLGCNMDGYIPIKFQPGDTIHITGRRATEMIPRSAFATSTI